MTRRTSLLETRLGRDAAQRVADVVGGTRLYVPRDPKNAGRLVRLFGADLAMMLVFHFADSRFYVPMLTRADPIDTKRFNRLTARGWSSARIARALACSERTVDRKRAARIGAMGSRK